MGNSIVATRPARRPSSERVDAGQVANLRERYSLSNGFVRIASFYDEEWNERPPITSGRAILDSIRHSGVRADLFTFASSLEEPEQVCDGVRSTWDNAAVVPITTFEAWWDKLPQEARKNVRRSQRRGVTTRVVQFDDALVRGIKRIYDETPIRQGRPFSHYGKSLETVKRENSSYLERSDFVGAFLKEELIGFVKIVYVGRIARIMQILSMNAHCDKRPPNALLAKCVELCCQRGMKYFVYSKYVYGNKRNSAITEFKRRTGFEELRFRRHYISLTFWGRIALATGLHLGWQGLLPEPLINVMLRLRTSLLARKGSVTCGVGAVMDE